MKDDAPSLRERYTAATNASRLVLTERPGSLDLLIAAGWIKETLATSLYRLMSDFDVARGQMRVALATQDRMDKAVDDEIKKAQSRRAIAHDKLEATSRSYALEEQAAEMAMQARAFALLELKHLEQVKQAVLNHAEKKAQHRRELSLSSRAVAAIVGRVIQALLDPLCPGCQGSGKVGIYPDQKLHTGKGPMFCGGSGRRRVAFSDDLEGELFGRWLLSDLERMTSRVDVLLAKFLAMSSQGSSTEQRDEAQRQLGRRLEGLRSVEAGAD